MITPMLQEFTISAAGKVIAAFVAGMVALAALGYSYVQPLWNAAARHEQDIHVIQNRDHELERQIDAKLDTLVLHVERVRRDVSDIKKELEND